MLYILWMFYTVCVCVRERVREYPENVVCRKIAFLEVVTVNSSIYGVFLDGVKYESKAARTKQMN